MNFLVGLPENGVEESKTEAAKIFDQFIFEKMYPHLKCAIILAYLEIEAFDQIVQLVEGEIKTNGL